MNKKLDRKKQKQVHRYVSALDNPSSFYSAQSLTNRASDLSSLLDSMGQGIQTIKAADEAITSITEFVQQAKAIANQCVFLVLCNCVLKV